MCCAHVSRCSVYVESDFFLHSSIQFRQWIEFIVLVNIAPSSSPNSSWRIPSKARSYNFKRRRWRWLPLLWVGILKRVWGSWLLRMWVESLALECVLRERELMWSGLCSNSCHSCSSCDRHSPIHFDKPVVNSINCLSSSLCHVRALAMLWWPAHTSRRPKLTVKLGAGMLRRDNGLPMPRHRDRD